LTQDIMRYLEERTLRIAEEPTFAEALAELDQRIEDEARARLQELDDQRALRRAGIKSAEVEDDEDDLDDEEDDGEGPEIIYVRGSGWRALHTNGHGGYQSAASGI